MEKKILQLVKYFIVFRILIQKQQQQQPKYTTHVTDAAFDLA